jgi:hypothetical protein
MRSRTLLAVAVTIACTPDQSGLIPPQAEFLVTTGSSTVWVRSGKQGVRLRSSPLVLARYGGRFYEVYVVDDDRSYYDAIFVGQRIYRRDLVTGDSALVYEDSVVPDAAYRYGSTHPREPRLHPDEEASESPRSNATTDVEILDLHGPFLSYEQHLDLDLAEGGDRHETRRGVVDLRSGRRALVGDVAGDTAGARVLREGHRTFVAALDSVLAAGDPRARRAASALGDFEFDSTSFVIANEQRRATVEFLAPGRRGEAGGLGLPLPPIDLGTPVWWREIVDRLPESSADSTRDRWSRPGFTVEARYDTASAEATLVLRDSAEREWVGGKLAEAASQIYWLDAPPLDSAERRGLARAFDEAAMYNENVRSVVRPRTPPLPRVVAVALTAQRPARPSRHRRVHHGPPTR